MHKYLTFVCIMSVVSGCLCACGSEYQTNRYELACKASGGEYKNNTCSCGGNPCENGLVCADGDNGKKQCTVITGDVVTNAYERACTDSGGVFGDNRCSCSGNPCENGMICVEGGSQCAVSNNAFELACISSGGVFGDNRCSCGGDTCENGMICVEGGSRCAVKSEDIVRDNAFELACKASGGEPDGKWRCKCGGEVCSDGIVCKQDGEEVVCALKLICNDGDLRCIDDKGIGRNQKCANGIWEFTTDCANGSSCVISDDGTSVCGECQNGSLSACEMGDDNIGKYKTCANGTWGESSACANDASCISADDGTSVCGECRNESTSVCEMGEDKIGTYKTCVDGKYSDVEKCENEVSCMLSEEGVPVCGECRDDETTSCETGEDKIGTYKTCTGGRILVNKCENEASCMLLEDGVSVCGECQNDSKTPCEMGTGTGGSFKMCVDGKYVENINTVCSGFSSCTILEDGSSVCGECMDGSTQCAGEHEYRVCNNGQWPEKGSIQCPGNAVCDENICRTEDLDDCEADGEFSCSSGKIRECVSGKYTVFSDCEHSDGCVDEHACGECSSGEVKCENINTGSKVSMCNTKNYRWFETYYNYSCKSESEVGVCMNGDYRFIPGDIGDINRHTVIQRCVNGLWPKGEWNDTDWTKWPDNSENDSLFTRIVNIHNSGIEFYTNYTHYLKSDSEHTFTLSSPVGECELEKSVCIGTKDFFNGRRGGCAGIYEFINYSYGSNSSLVKRLFSCDNTSCEHVSFCVDAITTGQFSDNIKPDSYIVTFGDAGEKLNIKIEKANGVCNSNRTAAKGDCTENAIDMTHYLQDLFIDNSSDEGRKFDLDENQSLDFDICRYGLTRKVLCNDTINSGKYSCKFNKIDTNGAFQSDSLCIDFYDKNYNHIAYKFIGINKTNETIVPLLDTDPGDGASYMIRCKSNLCNDDWTDCLDIP